MLWKSTDPDSVRLITRTLSTGGKFGQRLAACRIPEISYLIRVAQAEELASITKHRSLRFARLICGLISSGRRGRSSFSSSVRRSICSIDCFREPKLETILLNDSGELIIEISTYT